MMSNKLQSPGEPRHHGISYGRAVGCQGLATHHEGQLLRDAHGELRHPKRCNRESMTKCRVSTNTKNEKKGGCCA